MLAVIVLTLGATQTLQAQDDNNLPGINELQQDAIGLKQMVLTATRDERDERAELAAEAERVLDRFDRRIAALRQDILSRQEEMSTAAARYSDNLLASLREQREDVQRRLDRLGTEVGSGAANAWDHAIYNFSTAYDAFIESWEDVEANFPMETK